MTIEYCETCSGGGTVCVTCGKPRSKHTPAPRRKTFRTISSAHVGCRIRPYGVRPCPEHTETSARCEFCMAVTAPAVIDPRTGGMGAPKTWGRFQFKDACPTCFTHLSVSVDSVLESDFRLERARNLAQKNLRDALKTIDPERLRGIPATDLLDLYDQLLRVAAIVGGFEPWPPPPAGAGVPIERTYRAQWRNPRTLAGLTTDPGTSAPIGTVVGVRPDGSVDVLLNTNREG